MVICTHVCVHCVLGHGSLLLVTGRSFLFIFCRKWGLHDDDIHALFGSLSKLCDRLMVFFSTVSPLMSHKPHAFVVYIWEMQD